MTKVTDKINEIINYLEELSEIAPSDFNEYKSDKTKKAACERYVEKVVESMTDLAFIVIKLKKFKIPEDDIDAFNILKENKIINDNLTVKLKDAKGMRNILAHQYGVIDDRIIFESILELNKDANELIKLIKKLKL